MQSGAFIVPKHRRKTFMRKICFEKFCQCIVIYALFTRRVLSSIKRIQHDEVYTHLLWKSSFRGNEDGPTSLFSPVALFSVYNLQ